MYELAKYKNRLAIYCTRSNTFMIYEGENKKTKKELQEKIKRLNALEIAR